MIKKPLLPYKLLAQLLYQQDPELVSPLAEGVLLVRYGKLALEMGLQYSRIKLYFQHLEELGFLSELKYHQGTLVCKLLQPRNIVVKIQQNKKQKDTKEQPKWSWKFEEPKPKSPEKKEK